LDEINSFIESVTHNKRLNKNIKIIYQILTRIINNCHKLIVCDALISDNVFNLLNVKTNGKTIYLTNNFKKYAGISAINLNDENEFFNKLFSNNAKMILIFYLDLIAVKT